MKDNMTEYNVTCYVAVAVTVRGIRAATPAHAAMSVAVKMAEELDDGVVLVNSEAQPVELFVDGAYRATTQECDSSDIDGFLVETEGKDVAILLDRNGEPV